MPACSSNYVKQERPFIHAVSKSPDNFYEVFNKNKKVVSPLTVKTSKANFNTSKEDLSFISIPKTGTYAIYLQIDVNSIVRSERRSLFEFGVSKITTGALSESVLELDVLIRHLSYGFVGPAMCANLSALKEGDLLAVKLDSNIQVEFTEREYPIQVISYLISPER